MASKATSNQQPAPERIQPLEFEAEQCTAYKLGAFGYHRTEVREITVRVGRYAQHAAALRIEWVERGKRRRMGGTEAPGASLVVLAGYGHPDTSSEVETTTEADRALGMRVSHSRWTCFAPEWVEYFEQTHGAYIASKVVLADYRGFDTSGGARFHQLRGGAELSAGDRVVSTKGPGLIVKVKRRESGAPEAYQVRLDYALTKAVGPGDEARLWWVPAGECRWEGAP